MSDLAWPGESHETAHHMLERIIDEYDISRRRYLVRTLKLLYCMLGGSEALQVLQLCQRTPEQWIKLYLNGQSTSIKSWEAHSTFLKSRVLEYVDGKPRPWLRSLQGNHSIKKNQKIWADILDIPLSEGFGEVDLAHTAEILSDSWWGTELVCDISNATTMKRDLCISHNEFSMSLPKELRDRLGSKDLENLHLLVSIIENTIPSLSDPSRYVFLYPHVVEYKKALVRRTCAGNLWSQDLLRVIRESTSFPETILALAMLQQIDQMYTRYPQVLDHKADPDGNNAMNDFHFMLQDGFNRKSTLALKTTIASVLAAHNRYNQRTSVDKKICISNLRPVLGQEFNSIDSGSSNNNNELLSRYWDIRLSRELSHQEAYDEVSQEMKS